MNIFWSLRLSGSSCSWISKTFSDIISLPNMHSTTLSSQIYNNIPPSHYMQDSFFFIQWGLSYYDLQIKTQDKGDTSINLFSIYPAIFKYKDLNYSDPNN